MYKFLERICLIAWMLLYIASFSAIGMSMMVLTIDAIMHNFGGVPAPQQPAELISDMGRLMMLGMATLPMAIFLHLVGLKYLHFQQHEDGMSQDEESGPM